MGIKLYISRTSGNVLMKVHQDYIKRIFESKNIPYQEIDVADPSKKQDKAFMQTTLKLSDDDLVALPPQIFKEQKHRGDYDGFLKAVESEYVFAYLDMEVPKHEVEYLRKLEGKSVSL